MVNTALAILTRPSFPSPTRKSISQCSKKCTSLVGLGLGMGASGSGRRMLYQAYQAHCDIMEPVRALAASAAGRLGGRLFPVSLGTPALRNLSAAYELISRSGLTHTSPPFGIDRVTVGNREVEVREEPAQV